MEMKSPCYSANDSNESRAEENKNEVVYVEIKPEPVYEETEEAKAYRAFVAETVSQIDYSARGGQIVIEAGMNTCFVPKLIQKISERADLEVTINFVYKREEYTIVKPAGLDIMTILEEKDFYGLLYVNDRLNKYKY